MCLSIKTIPSQVSHITCKAAENPLIFALVVTWIPLIGYTIASDLLITDVTLLWDTNKYQIQIFQYKYYKYKYCQYKARLHKGKRIFPILKNVSSYVGRCCPRLSTIPLLEYMSWKQLRGVVTKALFPPTLQVLISPFCPLFSFIQYR